MASCYVTSALENRLLEHFNHVGKVWNLRVLLHQCEPKLKLKLSQFRLLFFFFFFEGELERPVITFYSDGVCVCVYAPTLV